jgi:hypothetical protein
VVTSSFRKPFLVKKKKKESQPGKMLKDLHPKGAEKDLQ